jgi:hypothetical protein
VSEVSSYGYGVVVGGSRIQVEIEPCRGVMREEELYGCWFDRNLRCLNELNLCLIRMNQFEWFED